MEARMTWNEIQKRFPRQFVYLKDVEWDPEHSTMVASAIVEHASEQPEYEFVARTLEGELFQEYTAPGTTLQLGALLI